MTTRQAARYLNTTVETVTRHARTGLIPAFKVGREWRFRKADLEALVSAGGPHYEALVDQGLATAMKDAAAATRNRRGKPVEDFLRERGL